MTSFLCLGCCKKKTENRKNDKEDLLIQKSKDFQNLKIKKDSLTEKYSTGMIDPTRDTKSTFDEKSKENNELRFEDNIRLIDPKFIREEEKDISFTKSGIKKLFYFLKNDTTTIWAPLYNKNSLVIDFKANGSFLSNKFLLFRLFYKIPKTAFLNKISLREMVNAIYEPVQRLKYDSSLKTSETIESGENYSVHRNHLKSPIFFISERDAVEKRVQTFEENTFYSFTSSVDDSVSPPLEGVVRCLTWINSLKLIESDDAFTFESYNQYDFKSPIPEKILNFTIPYKNDEWFKNFIKYLNEKN